MTHTHARRVNKDGTSFVYPLNRPMNEVEADTYICFWNTLGLGCRYELIDPEEAIQNRILGWVATE